MRQYTSDKGLLRLSHDVPMAGYLGTQKTTDRLQANFHWPEMLSEVCRYVVSYDVCQRTLPKGRVSKVPQGTTWTVLFD